MSTNTGKYIPENRQNDFSSDSVSANMAKRIEEQLTTTELDQMYGYIDPIKTGEHSFTGYVINMHPGTYLDVDTKKLMSCLDLYVVKEDGTRYKIALPFMHYFYIMPTSSEVANDLAGHLTKKFKLIAKVEKVKKEDLSLNNHLVGLKRTFLKVFFNNIDDLSETRREIQRIANKNKFQIQENTTFKQLMETHNQEGMSQNRGHKKPNENNNSKNKSTTSTDPLTLIADIFEYDMIPHVRISIDLEVKCGVWYDFSCEPSKKPTFTARPDIEVQYEQIVLAYDIETTKMPLKFPDSNIDQVMMISYMIDGQGFLITNREIVESNVEDFEYTPKEEFEGKFTVFNEANEKAVLLKFFSHIIQVKPMIIVTYNGDFFDWPFVETRAVFHGLDMFKQIGFKKNNQDTYECAQCTHMDAYCWVKRDSYLPVGSQGLKAATKAKLRYDPIELDPELMTPMAQEQPQILANYSVSDAVATYYLYKKYVDPFIFALCTIIPWEPDNVLRKGSGTLCESLLCVQAFRGNIIFPNKHKDPEMKWYKDNKRLVENETYTGGRVEALKSGIFRSDFDFVFDRLDPEGFEMLRSKVEKTINYFIEVEEGQKIEDVENYQEVIDEMKERLTELTKSRRRKELPLIYHFDVGAMYPNIILTNRLQPSAIVTEEDCAACDFNRPESDCQRAMEWCWRGDILVPKKSEIDRIRQQLEGEKVKNEYGDMVHFHKLRQLEQDKMVKERAKLYSKSVYKKVKDTREEVRESTICQRENPFYVNTVLAFRDRRYEFKGKLKQAKKDLSNCKDPAEKKIISGKVVYFDSQQLAHKCILNSFYGYMMRRGSRWFSMEVAGIVCYTGATIIKEARKIVEKVGQPLELDTDGIWCVLPKTFPDEFELVTKKGKKLNFNFMNSYLNIMVKEEFVNTQYQDLKENTNGTEIVYDKADKCTIFFEADGPYLAMFLPCAREEGRKLKKRYAVYTEDKKLSEIKGFELKRNGELELIKQFQEQVFTGSLWCEGKTLNECYAIVANAANHWLNILYTKAKSMPDEELFDLIGEKRSMSKSLAEYGAQKSTSITTAKRLAEFLGDQMVKDKGLCCNFIISTYPKGAPVTERAIPLAIFQAPDNIMKRFIKKWAKDNQLNDFSVRHLLDWEYYIERFANCIQKIITIPSWEQGVENPVPRVRNPDWVYRTDKRVREDHRQRRIGDFFQKTTREERIKNLNQQTTASKRKNREDLEGLDIEDIVIDEEKSTSKPKSACSTSKAKKDKKKKFTIEDLCNNWRDVLGDGINDENVKIPRRISDSSEGQKWLKFQKQKWKFMNLQRKKRKAGLLQPPTKVMRHTIEDDGAGFTSNSSARSSINSFIRKRNKNFFEHVWEIIQVSPTKTPGLYHLYVVINSECHCIKLNIPRIFYISRIEELPKKFVETADFLRKVTKDLPRSAPGRFLYECSIPESEFKSKRAEIFEAEINIPQVNGVYELGTPLELQIIEKLAIYCCVNPEKRHPSMSSAYTFNFTDLTETISEGDYLSDFEPKTSNFIYYHMSKQRQLCFMVIDDTIFIVVGNPAGNLQNITTGYVRTLLHNKIYEDEDFEYLQDILKKSSSDDSINTLYNLDELSIKIENIIGVKVSNSDKNFWTQISTCIENKINESSVSTKNRANIGQNNLFLLKSNFPSWYIKSQIRCLEYVPVISITSPLEPEALFNNSFDWQKNGIDSATSNFLESIKSFHSQKNMSEHTKIAIGNFPYLGDNNSTIHTNSMNQVDNYTHGKVEYNANEMYAIDGFADLSIFISDVFLARQLHAKNHLLWCSRTNKPDLGTLNYTLLENNLYLSMTDVKKQVSVNESGCYQTITVELTLNKLAVAAILNTTMVDDAEGGAAATNFNKINKLSLEEMMQGVNRRDQLTQHDQAALTSVTFGILKRMIVTWMKIATSNDESCVDMANGLLINFHRWIKAESSLLYDPAIYDQLHNYMKRYFFHLVAEFKRLGATVVHADFNKIILDTKKRGLKDAKAYIDYILERILKNSIFRALEFSIENWWSYLLYLDENNFGGMHIQHSEEENQNENNDRSRNEISCLDETTGNLPALLQNKSTFKCNFSMVSYLSHMANLRKNFLSIIQGFIVTLHDKLLGKLESMPVGQTPVRMRNNVSEVSSMLLDGENENSENVDPNTGREAAGNNFDRFKVKYVETVLQSQLVTTIETAIGVCNELHACI